MADPIFTPGPWSYIDATKSAPYKFAPICVIRAGDKQIASFSWNDSSKWFPSKDESQANAHLIAAAPDLLAALEALIGYDSYESECDGRMYSICPSCGKQDDDEHRPACEFPRARAALAKARAGS